MATPDDDAPATGHRAGRDRAGGADGDDRAGPGSGIVGLHQVGTGLLVGTSLGAAVLPDVLAPVHAALSVAAFAAGVVAFLWAYALAVGRSRSELVDLGGLCFLAGGAAPGPVAVRFRVALAVQVVAVVAAASVRPFTMVAFGILAPMLGIGLMALWAGRHGTFPAR